MSFLQPRWLRVLPRGLIVNTATLGPLGARLPAPGTWGSAAGLLYAVIFFRAARWEVTFAWTVVATALAAMICGEAEKRLG
jgi:phosphatidylglycerophosphatase A